MKDITNRRRQSPVLSIFDGLFSIFLAFALSPNQSRGFLRAWERKCRNPTNKMSERPRTKEKMFRGELVSCRPIRAA